MDRESVERLRFDRRLKTRPGWLDESQEETYLAELPDVSDKMTTCAAEEEDESEAASEEASVESPQAFGAAPVAGDFSTSGSLSPPIGTAGTFSSGGDPETN